LCGSPPLFKNSVEANPCNSGVVTTWLSSCRAIGVRPVSEEHILFFSLFQRVRFADLDPPAVLPSPTATPPPAVPPLETCDVTTSTEEPHYDKYVIEIVQLHLGVCTYFHCDLELFQEVITWASLSLPLVHLFRIVSLGDYFPSVFLCLIHICLGRNGMLFQIKI